jgi:hypothetical protein
LIVGVIGPVPGPDSGSIGCGNGLVPDLPEEANNNNPANLPILNETICTATTSPSANRHDHRWRSWAWW